MACTVTCHVQKTTQLYPAWHVRLIVQKGFTSWVITCSHVQQTVSGISPMFLNAEVSVTIYLKIIMLRFEEIYSQKYCNVVNSLIKMRDSCFKEFLGLIILNNIMAEWRLMFCMVLLFGLVTMIYLHICKLLLWTCYTQCDNKLIPY